MIPTLHHITLQTSFIHLRVIQIYMLFLLIITAFILTFRDCFYISAWRNNTPSQVSFVIQEYLILKLQYEISVIWYTFYLILLNTTLELQHNSSLALILIYFFLDFLPDRYYITSIWQPYDNWSLTSSLEFKLYIYMNIALHNHHNVFRTFRISLMWPLSEKNN